MSRRKGFTLIELL
ncbi:MAG: hypothetical protein DRP65_09480, partial [Planctomycetota bacterium]